MGNALVGFILVAIVLAIILNLVKNKKKGKSSCGGNCSHCHAVCHVNHTNETTLKIDGMMCPMCESHINDAIRNNFEVKSVKSNHKTGICKISSSQKLEKEKLRSVIEKTGYKLLSID